MKEIAMSKFEKKSESKSATKDPLLKASDSLAAQARLLRRVAAGEKYLATAKRRDAKAEDAVVDRLAKLGAEHRADEDAARAAQAAAARARYTSLIARAERALADNAAAVAETAPLLRRLAQVDYDAVRARAKTVPVAGSMETAQTRLSLLRRLVAEALPVLNDDDSDLRGWLADVKSFSGYEEDSQRAEYAANGVRGSLHGRAATLRSKAGAIRKLLAEVQNDLYAADADVVAEGGAR